MGFFDGGAKSLTYGRMDDVTYLNKMRGGVITDVSDEKAQTDWKTKAPVTRQDGSFKTQVVVTVKCDGPGPLLKAAYNTDPAVKAVVDQYGGPLDERTDGADDGRRGSYIKGTLRFDIGNKLREMGEKEPLPGGELYQIWTGKRDTPNGPGRTWTVLYFPPAAGSVAGGFYDQGMQQPSYQPGDAQHAISGRQGNAYGFGHQPVGSPGQQAYAAAGFGQQTPPPPFGGAPAAQQPPAPPMQPSAPADPWGNAPQAPAQPQPPMTPAPQAGPAQPSSSPWG